MQMIHIDDHLADLRAVEQGLIGTFENVSLDMCAIIDRYSLKVSGCSTAWSQRLTQSVCVCVCVCWCVCVSGVFPTPVSMGDIVPRPGISSPAIVAAPATLEQPAIPVGANATKHRLIS